MAKIAELDKLNKVKEGGSAVEEVDGQKKVFVTEMVKENQETKPQAEETSNKENPLNELD